MAGTIPQLDKLHAAAFKNTKQAPIGGARRSPLINCPNFSTFDRKAHNGAPNCIPLAGKSFRWLQSV